MLVTCPECGARYDIDGSLIPPAGRRVQCSACDHVWHQDGAADADAPGPVPTDADIAEAGTADAPAPRRPLAEGVRSILREEAAHDSRVRRQRGLREVQPDRAPAPATPEMPETRHAPAETGGLPDPEAINATLRAASSRAAAPGDGHERGRGGFRVGLGIGLGLVGLAALLYGLSGPLASVLPFAEALLESYVAAVDDLLLAIRGVIDDLASAPDDI
jgi:predicted Zn finger-like uncharacterized protein